MIFFPSVSEISEDTYMGVMICFFFGRKNPTICLGSIFFAV